MIPKDKPVCKSATELKKDKQLKMKEIREKLEKLDKNDGNKNADQSEKLVEKTEQVKTA